MIAYLPYEASESVHIQIWLNNMGILSFCATKMKFFFLYCNMIEWFLMIT